MANPNSVFNDDTPLIPLPVISSHEEMLELLLANGANLDAEVVGGGDAVGFGVEQGNGRDGKPARCQGCEEVLWQMRETNRMQST